MSWLERLSSCSCRLGGGGRVADFFSRRLLRTSRTSFDNGDALTENTEANPLRRAKCRLSPSDAGQRRREPSMPQGHNHRKQPRGEREVKHLSVGARRPAVRRLHPGRSTGSLFSELLALAMEFNWQIADAGDLRIVTWNLEHLNDEHGEGHQATLRGRPKHDSTPSSRNIRGSGQSGIVVGQSRCRSTRLVLIPEVGRQAFSRIERLGLRGNLASEPLRSPRLDRELHLHFALDQRSNKLSRSLSLRKYSITTHKCRRES